MRQGVGETLTYNMIIIFIIIVFGILAATMTYYKAFKVNNRILDSIEKFEGYNTLARDEIKGTLQNIGYAVNKTDECPVRNGLVAETKDPSYLYCVYYHNDETAYTSGKYSSIMGQDKKDGKGQPRYYNYSVVTYIYVDLPIAGSFKIPVHTKGERIFHFTDFGAGGNS